MPLFAKFLDQLGQDMRYGIRSGGGIRAGAPYRIGRIFRHHAAISKDLATTHRGRGVLNRDGFAGYGGGCLGGRALGGKKADNAGERNKRIS
jgi:hypothetical protein